LARRQSIRLLRLTPVFVNCGSIDLKLFVMGVLLSCIVFFNKRGGLQKTSPSTTLIRRRWAPVIKEREIEGGSQM